MPAILIDDDTLGRAGCMQRGCRVAQLRHIVGAYATAEFEVRHGESPHELTFAVSQELLEHNPRTIAFLQERYVREAAFWHQREDAAGVVPLRYRRELEELRNRLRFVRVPGITLLDQDA